MHFLQYLNKVYISDLKRHFYFEIQNFNLDNSVDWQKLQNLINISLWVTQKDLFNPLKKSKHNSEN